MPILDVFIVVLLTPLFIGLTVLIWVYIFLLMNFIFDILFGFELHKWLKNIIAKRLNQHKDSQL
jgi:hypothetical protein